jgi:serine/threonine protein kinase
MVGSHAPILYKIRNDKTSSDMSILVFDKENGSFFPNYDHYLQQCKVETVNSVTSSSDYLDVSSYCNVGDSVYTKDGQEVQLTVKINTGAEGLVFRTNDHKVVAKIYHRGILTPLRWMKLTHMTRVGLRAKGICWPTHLLYNQSKEPVGFIMPAAEGYTLGSVFDGPDAIMDRFPDWDRFSVTQAACQVLEKIIYLHLHGILIGDLQLKNIMIHNPSEVYLIDMDSVQIENLPCPVGTEDFTPPELWDHSFASFLREPQHEDYSCSILAFSMLTNVKAVRHFGKKYLRGLFRIRPERMRTQAFLWADMTKSGNQFLRMFRICFAELSPTVFDLRQYRGMQHCWHTAINLRPKQSKTLMRMNFSPISVAYQLFRMKLRQHTKNRYGKRSFILLNCLYLIMDKMCQHRTV